MKAVKVEQTDVDGLEHRALAAALRPHHGDGRQPDLVQTEVREHRLQLVDRGVRTGQCHFGELPGGCIRSLRRPSAPARPSAARWVMEALSPGKV